MIKFRFIDYTHDGVRLEMFVKSCDYRTACRNAHGFMSAPACIGWSQYNG